MVRTGASTHVRLPAPSVGEAGCFLPKRRRVREIRSSRVSRRVETGFGTLRAHQVGHRPHVDGGARRTLQVGAHAQRPVEREPEVVLPRRDPEVDPVARGGAQRREHELDPHGLANCLARRTHDAHSAHERNRGTVPTLQWARPLSHREPRHTAECARRCRASPPPPARISSSSPDVHHAVVRHREVALPPRWRDDRRTEIPIRSGARSPRWGVARPAARRPARRASSSTRSSPA